MESLSPYLSAISEIHGTEDNAYIGKTFSIQRVFGGANNALYKIIKPSEILACKLCVEDGRQRAAREFGMQTTLALSGIDIAPQPLAIDESKLILPYPVVIYRWIEGNSPETPLNTSQLTAFLDSYHKLHSIQPINSLEFQLKAWFHWFDFQAYLDEIRELARLYTPWLRHQLPDGNTLAIRLKDCITACEEGITKAQISPHQEDIPLRLTRVDPNISNAILGADGHIRWVDWEYSGWGDPALDIAELRWHAALFPLGRTARKWLRINYRPSFDDHEFWERIRIWDHILATRWPFLILRVLWSTYNGLDRERLSQVNTSSEQYYQRLCLYLKRTEAYFAKDDWELA